MNLLEQFKHVDIDQERLDIYKSLDENRDLSEEELLKNFIGKERDVIINDNKNGTYSIKYKHAGVNFEKNPLLLMARGLVLDENGKIVVRGFDKFFNDGELEERYEIDEEGNPVEGKRRYSDTFIKERSTMGDVKDTDLLTVTEKRDGSLVLVSTYKDDFIYATSSSAKEENPFVSIADNYFKDKKDLLEYLKTNNKTLAFEYTAPDKQILIFYNEKFFTLLAEIDNETGKRTKREDLELLAKNYNLEIVKEITMTYAELKRQQREAEGIEGFVAENQYGNLIKLKTDYWFRDSKVFVPIFLGLERGLSKQAKETIFDAYYDGTIDDLLAFENRNDYLKEKRVVGKIVEKIERKEKEIQNLLKISKIETDKEIGSSKKYTKDQKSLIFAYRKGNGKILKKVIKKQILKGDRK